MRRDMTERLTSILRDRKISGLKNFEILVKPYVTLREGVDHFVERANSLEANFILATTHARKGVTRWLIGSFAEALTEKSTVPVMIVNPEAESSWDYSSILFATDFSDESRNAFFQLLPMAQVLKAEICLYHKLTYLITPGLEPAFTGHSEYSKRVDEKFETRQKLGEEWVRLAKEAGVSVQVQIDAHLTKSPAEAVLAEAHKRRAWIAIAAQSKPVAAAFLGSTARRIIRTADVPVWVYRSK
jgi:nucleotide-binding universal stress UspA family protein